MDLGDLIIAIIGGFLGIMIARVGADRLEKPYRWKCGAPGCKTYAHANSLELVQLAQRIHYESHPEHEGVNR